MSGIAEQVAADHEFSYTTYRCWCGDEPYVSDSLPVWWRTHVAEVTERAVRQQVSDDIMNEMNSQVPSPTLVSGVFRLAMHFAAKIAEGKKV